MTEPIVEHHPNAFLAVHRFVIHQPAAASSSGTAALQATTHKFNIGEIFKMPSSDTSVKVTYG